MFTCPNCKILLKTVKMPNRVFWWCEKCKGRSATFGLLRQDVPDEIVNRLWRATRSGNFSFNRNCPSCRKLMAEVPMQIGQCLQVLDVCTACQFVWFDYGEYASLQKAQIETVQNPVLSKESEQKIEKLKANLKKNTPTNNVSPAPDIANKITKNKLDKFKKSQQYFERNKDTQPLPSKVIAPEPSKKIALWENEIKKSPKESPKKLTPASNKGSLSPEGITRPEKEKNYKIGSPELKNYSSLPPNNWHFTPGILGLPLEKEAVISGKGAWLTWVIAVIISVVSFFSFSDLEKNSNAIGISYDNFNQNGISIFLKSFFIQKNVFLLLINMYFLILFGSLVEEFLGKWRFIILLLLATLFGDLLHILAASPTSSIFIGASGGITGVMAFYTWRFPRSKIDLLFNLISLPNWCTAPAYAVFMFWLMILFIGIAGLAPVLSQLSFLSILGGITIGVTYWFMTRETKYRL
jgi:membrane associated rhomboid family serine protease/Zn-finger nucleic acid-binding protein